MICISDLKLLACLYPNLVVILLSIMVTNSVALTNRFRPAASPSTCFIWWKVKLPQFWCYWGRQIDEKCKQQKMKNSKPMEHEGFDSGMVYRWVKRKIIFYILEHHCISEQVRDEIQWWTLWQMNWLQSCIFISYKIKRCHSNCEVKNN